MKSTNMQDGSQMGIKERLAKGIGERLSRMAVEPRGCAFFILYEPELPPEMINELHSHDQ